ncbi:small GTP-binding protein [Histomonas meleagridis]|uniref:small GTP-binding protein n=1 Tax=Histomonas meleagridis TaxID=135588 RepID=UPI00355A48AB|nr:small GTP-binding protein [Histomonas meleagridis]KAH0799614.1 small GTP-binding protein [Histomonas meleagridis]
MAAPKAVFLGDTGIGKTTILLRIYKDKFTSQTESTIGVSFITKTFQSSSGKQIDIHFCDTAGQERFRSIVPMYVRDCAAAIIVCSVDNYGSIEHLQEWYDLLDQNNKECPYIYVLLNKCDLPIDKNNEKMVEAWANGKEITMFKVTATIRESIEPFLYQLVEDIAKLSAPGNSQSVSVKAENGEENKKCCS